MDFIEKIKKLAQKQYSLGINTYWGKRLFNHVATMDQIREFEDYIQMELPESFVRYLTECGNGGMGADYGIWSLKGIIKENRDIKDSGILKPMLDHSLTDQEWTEFAQKYDYIDNMNYETDAEELELRKQIREMEKQMEAGGIFISTPGCTMKTILMCKGAAKGEVFCLDYDYMFDTFTEPWCGGSFEDWMIKDMKRSIYRKEHEAELKSYRNATALYNLMTLNLEQPDLSELEKRSLSIIPDRRLRK